MRRKLEYAAAWPFIKLLGILPRLFGTRVCYRDLSVGVSASMSGCGGSGCAIWRWLFPKKCEKSGSEFCAAEFTSLGRQLAELCQFPRYTPENVDEVVVYEQLENYERAYARGKGVLFLTAHFGGWELSAFAHSLHGHRVNIVMRPMDNPYLDRMLQNYRTMHGNKVVPKDDFVRGSARGHESGRDRRDTDGHQYDAAAGRIRGLLRHSRVYSERPGAHRVANRRGRGPWIHDLGRIAAQVSTAV